LVRFIDPDENSSVVRLKSQGKKQCPKREDEVDNTTDTVRWMFAVSHAVHLHEEDAQIVADLGL
jgi:hypothetical protein